MYTVTSFDREKYEAWKRAQARKRAEERKYCEERRAREIAYAERIHAYQKRNPGKDNALYEGTMKDIYAAYEESRAYAW